MYTVRFVVRCCCGFVSSVQHYYRSLQNPPINELVKNHQVTSQMINDLNIRIKQYLYCVVKKNLFLQWGEEVNNYEFIELQTRWGQKQVQQIEVRAKNRDWTSCYGVKSLLQIEIISLQVNSSVRVNYNFRGGEENKSLLSRKIVVSKSLSRFRDGDIIHFFTLHCVSSWWIVQMLRRASILGWWFGSLGFSTAAIL